MNSLEEVPFRSPVGTTEGEVLLVSAPELQVSDCLRVLQEMQYDFHLENWVVTGFDRGCPRGSWLPLPCSSFEAQPSCPPYWLMFRSPQENRLANRRNSDLWEPTPRPRSHSLNAAAGGHPRVKFVISDSEGDDGYSEDDESSFLEDAAFFPVPGRSPRRISDFRDWIPERKVLTLSPCPASRRKRGFLSSIQKFKQASLSVLDRPIGGNPLCQGRRFSKSRQYSHVTRDHLIGPRPSSSSPTNRQRAEASPEEHVTNHQPPLPTLGPSSGLTTDIPGGRALGSHACILDSSAELLSALSQDEQDLLEAIVKQGYPLRTAIITLQKTGQQSPEKILSYLLACDRLCELGYAEAQVEEALEMFQNCETKAAEFLHLLSQFDEMGFQQNTIKEVLLVHENHRERALEELMTRVA